MNRTITHKEFERFRLLISRQSGINLTDANITDFSGLDQFRHGANRIFHRHFRVNAVKVI